MSTAQLWVDGARRNLDRLEEVEPEGVKLLFECLFHRCCSNPMTVALHFVKATYLRRLRNVVDDLSRLHLPVINERNGQASPEARSIAAALQLIVAFPVRVDVLDQVVNVVTSVRYLAAVVLTADSTDHGRWTRKDSLNLRTRSHCFGERHGVSKRCFRTLAGRKRMKWMQVRVATNR